MSEKEDKESRKEKRDKQKDELDPEKVHSANSWESADMGDDDRKKKFLRLMGASKKEHSGRFVIGDKDQAPKHGRGKDDTDKVNRELEDQYKHSNDRKVNRFSHKGLGFSDEKTWETEQGGDNHKQDTGGVEESGQSKSLDTDRKRESEESRDSSAACPPKKPKMMMNFVKASD